jgi:hypothetical protein
LGVAVCGVVWLAAQVAVRRSVIKMKVRMVSRVAESLVIVDSWLNDRSGYDTLGPFNRGLLQLPPAYPVEIHVATVETRKISHSHRGFSPVIGG